MKCEQRDKVNKLSLEDVSGFFREETNFKYNYAEIYEKYMAGNLDIPEYIWREVTKYIDAKKGTKELNTAICNLQRLLRTSSRKPAR